jgi:hypothetical protein
MTRSARAITRVACWCEILDSLIAHAWRILQSASSFYRWYWRIDRPMIIIIFVSCSVVVAYIRLPFYFLPSL